MNIGITCYPTYGGSGVVATELGKELAERGHKIHFISYSLPFRLDVFQENIVFHEVELPEYPLFEFNVYPLSLTSKMVDVVLHDNLDILHVHYAIPHASSAYMAKQILAEQNRDIKIVTTLHGTDITLIGLDPTLLPLVRFSIDKSDGVTAVSEYLRRETLNNFTPCKDVEVIPNFVDTENWKHRDNSRLRGQLAPDGDAILTHISNFRPVKRVTDVVRVFEIVQRSVPSKLVMVGDGPDRAEAERLCRELGIIHKVWFLGKQTALTDILSVSDVMIMPSANESFGLSALEAMSCSVPVISSTAGGLTEVNLHGITGFNAAVGDIQTMADFALTLLHDKELHATMAAAARNRAVDNFSSGAVVTAYENHYKHILSNS